MVVEGMADGNDRNVRCRFPRVGHRESVLMIMLLATIYIKPIPGFSFFLLSHAPLRYGMAQPWP